MTWSRQPPTPVADLDEPQRDLLHRLGVAAHVIAGLELELSAARDRRLLLYREGVELGLTKSHLGTAAGCSPEAVTKALSRAEAPA